MSLFKNLIVSVGCCFFLSLVLFYMHVKHMRRSPKLDASGTRECIIITYKLDAPRDWRYDFTKTKSATCPYRCAYTEDLSQLYRADAVFFHGMSRDLFIANSTLLNPRPEALYDQPWIFRLSESPISRPDPRLLPYPDVFNWTMTYRHDSDIYSPYGQFKVKGQARNPLALCPVDLSSKGLSRRKLVVAMISNCSPDSHRLQYVELMRKHVKVDMYGRCGNLKCTQEIHQCYEKFAKRYKFFLAFENSFCADYITEKAFHPLRYGMVPVVRGGVNYSSVLPPGSYIDTKDFLTVQALTTYLRQLNSNDGQYRQYFKWRRNFEMESDIECEFCQRIHSFNVSLSRKSYSNISDWHHTNYTGKILCTHPPVLLE